jgi:hypothetical protein
MKEKEEKKNMKQIQSLFVCFDSMIGRKKNGAIKKIHTLSLRII